MFLRQLVKNVAASEWLTANGATGRTRTDGLRITNALLYQLSHSSIFNFFFYSVLVLNLSLSSAFGLRIYGQKYSRSACSRFALLVISSPAKLPLPATGSGRFPGKCLLYQLSHSSIFNFVFYSVLVLKPILIFSLWPAHIRSEI